MRVGAMFRAACQENDRPEVGGLPGQDVDKLPVDRRHDTALYRLQQPDHFELHIQCIEILVIEGYPACNGGGGRNPDLDTNIQLFKWGTSEGKVIGIEGFQSGCRKEGSRVGNPLSVNGKGRKDAHRPCLQAITGAETQNGSISSEGFDLPGVVIDVIRLAESEVSREGQTAGILRVEGPGSHGLIIRQEG